MVRSRHSGNAQLEGYKPLAGQRAARFLSEFEPLRRLAGPSIGILVKTTWLERCAFAGPSHRLVRLLRHALIAKSEQGLARTADEDRRQERAISSRGSGGPGKEQVRKPGPNGI